MLLGGFEPDPARIFRAHACRGSILVGPFTQIGRGIEAYESVAAIKGPHLDCLQTQNAVARPAPFLILLGQWSRALLGTPLPWILAKRVEYEDAS